MVQTLVENGIKHGTSQLPNGGEIKIDSRLENDNLIITIYNDGNYDETQQPDTGFGLINTKQRLQLLYGDHAHFKIVNEDGKVKTELIIPKNII